MADTCEEKLAEARAALHKLQIGEQVATIRKGDRTVEYRTVNIGELRAYIADLIEECGSSSEQSTARRRPFKVIW